MLAVVLTENTLALEFVVKALPLVILPVADIKPTVMILPPITLPAALIIPVLIVVVAASKLNAVDAERMLGV